MFYFSHTYLTTHYIQTVDILYIEPIPRATHPQTQPVPTTKIINDGDIDQFHRIEVQLIGNTHHVQELTSITLVRGTEKS